MTEQPSRILVLGLGNDILGDDAVGLLAARRLRLLLPECVEVIESAGSGLDLLDLLEGCHRVLILDAIATGKHPAGTILEFTSADFQKVVAPSPHYAGLPELLRLAEQLGIPFPAEIRILACEVADPYQIREGVGDAVLQALPTLVAKALTTVSLWLPTPPRA